MRGDCLEFLLSSVTWSHAGGDNKQVHNGRFTGTEELRRLLSDDYVMLLCSLLLLLLVFRNSTDKHHGPVTVTVSALCVTSPLLVMRYIHLYFQHEIQSLSTFTCVSSAE